jgi:hypothetical protein
MGVGRGANNPTCKKKIAEKPPRNSAGFCGGGQGLSWAVEPRKEEEEDKRQLYVQLFISRYLHMSFANIIMSVCVIPILYVASILFQEWE